MLNKLFFLVVGLFFIGEAMAQNEDLSYIPYRKGDKWGYVNADKQIIIQPKYTETAWFSEGLAAVKIGSKWGYINKEGKLVIPARYTVAKPFRIGYMPGKNNEEGAAVIFAGASLTPDGYEICINSKGVRMPQCPAISENTVEGNENTLSILKKQKTYSLPDNEGLFDEIIDDYSIAGNPETFYIAVKENLYGVFNSKFETIVPFIFDSIAVVRKTQLYLSVIQNGKTGILDAEGKILIEPTAASIIIISNSTGEDFAIVKNDGNAYIATINKSNDKPDFYSNISDDQTGGFILTGLNGDKGYLLSDGTVIKPKYQEIYLLKNGKFLRVVTSTGKWGYISISGEEYYEE